MSKLKPNSPCTCSSGRKWKHCCAVKDRQAKARAAEAERKSQGGKISPSAAALLGFVMSDEDFRKGGRPRG